MVVKCFIYLFSTGSSLSHKVQQRPAHIYKTQSETAKIHCSHSIDSYNVILWYKQINNRELQLLGYMVGSSDFLEPGSGVEMDGNANKDQNVTLTIEGLNLNSSAVYFCAASLHSETHHLLLSTKTCT